MVDFLSSEHFWHGLMSLLFVCPIGNNIFGEDIRTTLQSAETQRSQFIVMDLIQPPNVKNYIVRPEFDEAELASVVSELGVFGVIIR